MEVPGLGVKSELQLPATATAIAMPDTSQVCDLCHSLQQHQISNSLIEARGWTRILMDTSWVLNLLSHDTNCGYILDLSSLYTLHEKSLMLYFINNNCIHLNAINILLNLLLILLLLLLSATPRACWSSQVRDQTQATAVTMPSP